MATVKLLPQELINKIAAGEVVERPASVVKELIENAVDANANEITVAIEKAGLQKIEVSDNGSGMDKTDAELSLVQHTTSKISNLNDLFNIKTMGFRGEALASISSIAELNLHTYDNKNEPVIVYQRNGKIKSESGNPRQQGTTVTVTNLFANVPARKKFLRSEPTEYKYTLEVFLNLALANFTIGFKLIKDGKLIYNLLACQKSEQRILQVFPNITSADLIPIFCDDPAIKITGFIGHPRIARSDNTQQFLFINSRYIKDGILNKAVKEGFATSIMRDQYPCFYLYYQINPDLFDINVHPRKLEVKFSDPGKMYYLTKTMVNKALNKSLQSDFYNKFDALNPEAPRANFTPLSTDGQKQDRSGLIKESLEFSKLLLEQSRLDLQKASATDISPQFEFAYLQVFNTYIIIGEGNKLQIIDQHAADERVRFEAITSQIEKEGQLKSQNLLLPQIIKLNQLEIETILENYHQIESLGFKFKRQGNNLNLESVPLLLSNENYDKTIRLIVNDLIEAGGNGKQKYERAKDKIIATIACHSSIRAGRKLHQSEVVKLISDLFKCQLPYSCPHGRPIIWEINRYELEKKFKRKV
jgi:DNA mismatch repair protein MutL